MTTCLENLEISGHFKDVREKSWKIGIVREKMMSGKIIVSFLWPYQ